MVDIDLLRDLLEIPSLSGQEAAAVRFLVSWMAEHGFESFVDEAGNAVGIRDGGPGEDGSPPRDIVLLGHIDTVAGEAPVRVEAGKLFGRGAVDAKGPLAAFATAASLVQPEPGWRLIVIGAVEEEAATSKGARFAATQYRPTYCIIGEPSGYHRLTLGYKGRLLAEATATRAMSHTAGPETSAAEMAFAFWRRVTEQMAEINRGRERAWEQVLPSLRGFASDSDGLTESAWLHLGFRLPLDVPPAVLAERIRAVADGMDVTFRGAEPAYQASKNTALVRAFLAAIRAAGGRPGFVNKTGTSDMNVVGPVWRCPILAYGPGDSALDHTPHEHVEIEEWQAGVKILADALTHLMG